VFSSRSALLRLCRRDVETRLRTAPTGTGPIFTPSLSEDEDEEGKTKPPCACVSCGRTPFCGFAGFKKD